MENEYEAIVIGLGAMGSASTYQLAKRGVKVLGIDRYAPPHKLGSTHGSARIMRLAIGEGAHYTPLSKRSYELFREIEGEAQTKLLDVTGMLTISSVDKEKIVPEGDFFGNTVSAALKYDVRHDVLDADDIRRRFPQFKVRDDEKGYYEYDAGYLRPEQCVRAQLMLAGKFGASISTNEVVENISATESGVTIRTDHRVCKAQQVVVAAGPWISELLDLEYRGLFQSYRLAQFWYDISNSRSDYTPGKCPIYFWQLPGYDKWMFGFPALGGIEGGLPLSVSNQVVPTTPDTADRSVSEQEIETVYKEYVERCLFDVGRRALKTDVCLYTATPDGGFVIDRDPGCSRVIVCSPCSGHGFKHSAAIGECVAEMITSAQSTIDLGAFKFDRLLRTALV
jgi:sarcosine oxidase